MSAPLDARSLVALLKAAAEPTRLRILLLLSRGEFNVKDLTRILGQSQPRISRHLKLLAEAGLVERVREGSWSYFHLAHQSAAGDICRSLIGAIDPADAGAARDADRAEALKLERVEAAQAFFAAHAAEWDSIRSLHLEETQVEAAMLDALGAGPFDVLVDLGTGTGRMLELFADSFRRGIGIDGSQPMLSYARAKLDRSGTGRAQVRQGDICNLGLDDRCANAVVMHQVLHFLADPGRAIREAARILAPGGRLLLVDFAQHELDFLRDTYAHVRLGFSRAEVGQWLSEAGLHLVKAIDLAPPPSAEGAKLTVSIWVGEQPMVQRGTSHGAMSRTAASPAMGVV